MPFKKGQSGNNKGRPTGAKSEKTIQWEELGEALIARHSERANQIMSTCDDDVFMDNYTKLLEYFKPKQARVEMKSEGNITVEFIRPNVEDSDTPK